NDDLKKQSAPTKKPTTLNQWKRIVYHDEDPLKLYNSANAPVWYVNSKEENCLFVVGLFRFIEKKYGGALEIWNMIDGLNPDVSFLQAENSPNILMRLRIACQLQAMAFSNDEKKLFENSKQELMLALMELKYMLEDFDGMDMLANRIIKDPKSSPTEKAAAFLGKGIVGDMSNSALSETERLAQAKFFEQAVILGKETIFEDEALMRLACYYDAGSTTKKQAKETYQKYLKQFPKGRYADKIWYRVAYSSMINTKITKNAQNILKQMKINFPTSKFTITLEEILNDKGQLNFLGVK
ncbi:MAG: hypothetical protein RR261_07265, partial [Oscillospiraceae bacterium]